jgi:hypothetical protein
VRMFNAYESCVQGGIKRSIHAIELRREAWYSRTDNESLAAGPALPGRRP